MGIIHMVHFSKGSYDASQNFRFQESGGPSKFLQQVIQHMHFVPLFFFIELQR